MFSLPLPPGPAGEGRTLAAQGVTPSGMGMMLRSLRCRLGTGASRTSLLSPSTGGRVKVISYLWRIFRKPTCSRREKGGRHFHSLLPPGPIQVMPPMIFVGLNTCFPRDPRGATPSITPAGPHPQPDSPKGLIPTAQRAHSSAPTSHSSSAAHFIDKKLAG